MRTVNPPKRESNIKSEHNYKDKSVGTEAKKYQSAPNAQKQKQIEETRVQSNPRSARVKLKEERLRIEQK